MKAWSDAGIKTELHNAMRSKTINSMFGCNRHYEVFLNEHMVVVMEYNLEKLDSNGKRTMDFIENNGYEAKSNEPAWRGAEFILSNSASIIESGETVKRFKMTEHPDREKILATFKAFR